MNDSEAINADLDLPTILGSIVEYNGSKEDALRNFASQLKRVPGFHTLKLIKESKFGPFPFEIKIRSLDQILALDATASPSIPAGEWRCIAQAIASTFERLCGEEMNQVVESESLVSNLSEVEMLKQSEGFLREVLDVNPSLITVKDRQRRFVFANQAVAEVFGCLPSQLIGKLDSDFAITDEQKEQFRCGDNKVLEGGGTIQINEQITDKTGFVRTLKTVKKPIETPDGVSHILVVSTDVTNQVETQQALEDTKQEAEKATLAKAEFLTRMSHELRTPLNAILGFNQLLQRDENLNDTQRDTLAIVNKSGNHLLNLINEVLEMTKLEMGDLKLSPSAVDLIGLVEGVVALFEARANANDCSVNWMVGEDLPKYIYVDEVKFRQIVHNLVSNAVKFTQDGEVGISVLCLGSSDKPGLRFMVRDSGKGIAAAEADAVFEAFRQTDTGKKSEEGTGLGLSTCKQLVFLMGGEIGFESDEGIGSVFHFEIPLVAAENPLPTKNTSPVSQQNSGVGYKVLIADDAPANRLFVSRLLDRLGYEILEAENGLEAVDAHLCEHPDLILMDVKMPEMDGMTATATIRSNEQTHHLKRVPIIALTANAFEEHRRKAFEVGCDDFIAKPFDFNHLIQAISDQIEN